MVTVTTTNIIVTVSMGTVEITTHEFREQYGSTARGRTIKKLP